MTDTYWGVSCGSSGAALAVYSRDRKRIVFASKSERFSGKKGDTRLDIDLQEHALAEYGQPSEILFSERKWVKQLRRIWQGSDLPYESEASFLLPELRSIKRKSYSHHETHAVTGFNTSPFSKAIVLVMDAVGELDTVSVWLCEGPKRKCVYKVRYPTSLGLFYSAMTKAAGLKPDEEEHILMGASTEAYSGTIIRDDDMPKVDDTHDRWPVFKSHIDWNKPLPEHLTGYSIYDYARTAQATLTKYVLAMLRFMYERYHSFSENLVLSGGVFMNCVLNAIVAHQSLFSKIHIPVDPGDAGSAIGAILCKTKERLRVSPFLGVDAPGVDPYEVAGALIYSEYVGVVTGRAEFGDRALGNRSILALPSHTIKSTLNALKQRQPFRPFAPVVRDKDLKHYFKVPSGIDCSQMQYALMSTEDMCLFNSVLHVDFTGRVQSVGPNHYLYTVLTSLEKDFQCPPILLNTSLNVKGQPMVNTKADVSSLPIHLI